MTPLKNRELGENFIYAPGDRKYEWMVTLERPHSRKNQPGISKSRTHVSADDEQEAISIARRILAVDIKEQTDDFILISVTKIQTMPLT